MTPLFTTNLTSKRRPEHRSAFTLIELLTVIAIIGILAAILIPTVARVRQSARDTKCAATIRQYAFATQLFAEDHKGKLPETAYRSGHYGHYDLIDYFNVKRTGGDRITMFSCRVKPGAKDPDNPNWIYGLNEFISMQPISSITQPSRLILATCSTGGWLDRGAMSGSNSYLKTTPKPHAGKVSVVRLAGNVTREKVSTLLYADVTRDTPKYEPTHETTYFFGGDSQYDQ
ncbi:prepilin-type N-terminal cleavage/methylation domain-containing protein [Opitutaceae bacterium TAV4]|uniref:type II secretion system protein n=1 Tax=Geminisphaera colitermitum TaxID=1148786 RepID=UPI0001964FCD|nr:prepilin-type N-terminal cleavage/methylation domain-containing protein [Geminisphaera colitermitum]RRJ94777.1 prepilin-type N-terminal cleavage/methylation domain-containing protein [Opitutaceae bacterium TAV4]RRJ98845.1 prepilin-type N-terminal cleavage/methylation domain-containing protein [Opitutaceae bacterium TAV3]